VKLVTFRHWGRVLWETTEISDLSVAH